MFNVDYRLQFYNIFNYGIAKFKKWSEIKKQIACNIIIKLFFMNMISCAVKLA